VYAARPSPQVRLSRRNRARASTTVRRRASARAGSTCVPACTALATSRNMRDLSLRKMATLKIATARAPSTAAAAGLWRAPQAATWPSPWARARCAAAAQQRSGAARAAAPAPRPPRLPPPPPPQADRAAWCSTAHGRSAAPAPAMSGQACRLMQCLLICVFRCSLIICAMRCSRIFG